MIFILKLTKGHNSIKSVDEVTDLDSRVNARVVTNVDILTDV